MSGGKGGTQTTQVQIPAGLERAAYQNLALADAAGQLGYVPYTGPTVAGLSDQQRAGMANTNAAAGAFGMASAPIGTGGGQRSPSQQASGQRNPQTVSQGMDMARNPMYGPVSANDPNSQGYSPYGLYQQAVNNIAPGQANHLAQFFVDPTTGAMPSFQNPGSRVPLSRAAGRGGKK